MALPNGDTSEGPPRWPRLIVILGGTSEAVQLAGLLEGPDAFYPITSLAGRTTNPAKIPGSVRIKPFSGLDGFVEWLKMEQIDAVVDATHPFAAKMSQTVIQATEKAGVPFAQLVRSEWQKTDDDLWHQVDNLEDAARMLPRGSRCFLAIGSQTINRFAGRQDCHFLMRMMEMPDDEDLIPPGDILLQKPSLDVRAEKSLLRRNNITCVVSKNSGGAGAFAKIEAARALGLPVYMIKRPDIPVSNRFEDPADVFSWLDETLLAPQRLKRELNAARLKQHHNS